MSWKEKIDLVAFDADQTILACHLHNICMHYIKEHRADIEAEFNISIIEFNDETGCHMGMNSSATELTEKAWKAIYERITKKYPISTAGDKSDWQIIFSHLLASPYKVAIVSFTAFKPILALFLQDSTQGPGLTKEQMREIVMITGLPPDHHSKSMHITHARKQLGLPNPDNMQTTLIFDDNQTIVSNHKKLGGVGEHLPFDYNQKNASTILTKLIDKGLLSPSTKKIYSK